MIEKNRYFSEVFSELLNQWCEKHNTTQAQFAKKLGLNANMVSRYKNGDAYPRDFTLDCIADALEVDKSIFTPSRGQLALHEIGKTLSDPEKNAQLSKDLDKMSDTVSRLLELGECFDTLKEIYIAPEYKTERSIEDEFLLVSFIDAQLEHAFKTYFKFIHSSCNENKNENDLASFFTNVIDGAGYVFKNFFHALEVKQSEFEKLTNEEKTIFLQNAKEKQKNNY